MRRKNITTENAEKAQSSQRKLNAPCGARASFHVAPVGAGLGIHNQRDAQFVNALHHFLHEFREARQFLLVRLEKQFVVNLQDHSRFEFAVETAVELDHGELDEISGGALHG